MNAKRTLGLGFLIATVAAVIGGAPTAHGQAKPLTSPKPSPVQSSGGPAAAAGPKKSIVDLVSGGASPVAAPGPAASTTSQVLKTLAVRVAPDVKKAIAQKSLVNPSQIQRSVSYRGNSPVLRLGNTRQFALLPAQAETRAPAPVVQGANKLDGTLSPLQEHIMMKSVGRASTVLPHNTVDHLERQTPIRDQGDRQTCVAHASMAALEAAYKARNASSRDLSENHAFHLFAQGENSSCKADTGVQAWKAADYLMANKICPEPSMPYTNEALVPSEDSHHVPATCTASASSGVATSQVVLGTEFGGEGSLTANNPNYLESILTSGYDVVFAVYVAGSDWSDGSAETGIIDVQKKASGDPADAYGGHAMLLVGFNRPKKYFIFKNSWGSDRGHNGYYHLSYDYIRAYAKYGFYIKSVAN